MKLLSLLLLFLSLPALLSVLHRDDRATAQNPAAVVAPTPAVAALKLAPVTPALSNPSR
ncbi:MAG TPA: hypothetical protein VG710_08755 [Opitutus sp.]|nr:hypothetical protein [Opitutus sp.]